MKLKQRLKNNFSSPEAGYTIIEGLVAMIMVSALMVAVAPVIAFSVGTRVQARRVELAAQAARSYIDWVRAGNDSTERANRSPDAITENPDDDNPGAPAGGGLNCPTDGEYCTGSKELYCVNGDENPGCDVNSSVDMIVQAASFSNDGSFYLSPTTGNYDQGYELSVRVYRADAFSPSVGILTTTTPATTVTNAVGARSSPLVRIITDVAPLENSFRNLRNRL